MRKIKHPFWGQEDIRGVVIRWVITGLIVVIIGALFYAFKHTQNMNDFGSRVVPGVLFSAFGVLGVGNMAANIWLYRRCNLPIKGEVTIDKNPLAYWLTFATLAGLFLTAFVVGIFFLTGIIHIHAQNLAA